MRKCRTIAAVAAVVLIWVSGAQADMFGTGGNQFDIDFVPISGATNPAIGYGIVNNDYRMGTLEITNDQWDKFKAAYGTVTGDPYYAYGENPSWTGTDVPTNEVSWYEAAQFVNYLNTSTGNQPAYKFTGTQGTGDYTLGTWSAAEADNGTNLYRHKDAMYYMPTEDECVKARYWNGTALQTYPNASPGDLVS
ncbi:MAG: SUMF1/EgtB/PvdO family nonheme iron enzyme, partial [bacterium]|nr:SUMF1/EgtB/PvdO family nonheme iron enzyme [bacterium]